MSEKQIRKWIEAYDGNGYLQGSILVASNEKILIKEGFGKAVIEHDISNTPSTKYRIGSITKGFTSMAIFMLHEARKLKITDRIGKYLPDFPNGDKITVYHCLTNTSGLSDFTGFPNFWSQIMRLPLTLDEVIDLFKNKPLDFKPGSQFNYSTSGYIILTKIIEKVGGGSYRDFVRQNIFLPLGMSDTDCDNGRDIAPGLAGGYSFWEKSIRAEFTDMSFPTGGYGLYSTTEDLYKWDRALSESKLIGASLMRKMFAPFRNFYACGWWTSPVAGKNCLHHFGDISGYANEFLRFTDDALTIIFLSNMNVTPVSHLAGEMARVFFKKRVRLPEPLIEVRFDRKEALAGVYFSEQDESRKLEITLKNNEIFLTTAKMYDALYKFKLIPISADAETAVFLSEMIYEKLSFNFSNGKLTNLEYLDYHGNAGYYKKS